MLLEGVLVWNLLEGIFVSFEIYIPTSTEMSSKIYFMQKLFKRKLKYSNSTSA